MFNSTRPTVKTFYLLEPDSLRKEGNEKLGAFALRDKLRRAVQQATGSVTFSRDKTIVFHRSAESRSVRHSVRVHSAFEWQPSHHTGQFFDAVVRPALDSSFVDQRDAIFFSVGNAASLKSVLLHGKTLDQGSRLRTVLDQYADSGLLHRSAEYLLKKLNDPSERGQASTFNMTASASCVQLDHASDIIVPPPVKDPYAVNIANQQQSRDDIDKEHQRLIRLVALARASTLEPVWKGENNTAAATPTALGEENNNNNTNNFNHNNPHTMSSLLFASSSTPAGSSSVIATTPDQTEYSIRAPEDIQHVINCLSAVDTHREAHQISSQQSAPFYLITTLILRACDTATGKSVDDPAAPCFRIRFVECADFDWAGSAEEDTHLAQHINGSLTAALCALSVWQREIAYMRIKESLTSQLVFSDLSMSTMSAFCFGTASYKTALPTMDFLARVRDSALWVVLHGADGEEDESVVDEELKAHMSYVQQQCDDLRRQVVRLNASKELLAKSVEEEDGQIQKLQEQLSLLRRLSADNVRTREELIEIFEDKAEKQHQAKLRVEQEKMMELESKHRAIRVGALERELDTLKQEESQKDAALESQIQSISAETRRLIQNAITLEAEAEELTKKIKEQDAKYEEIQKQHEQAKIQKMNEMMDTRWAELEAHSRERLEAVRTAEVNAKKRQGMIALQNRAYAEAMNRPIARDDANALRIAKEKIRQLEDETTEVETTSRAVTHQLKRDAAKAKEEVGEAEAETRILAKYLHDITRILWRFENTSGYAMDNLSQLPKLGVPVFDPLSPVDITKLRNLCRKCRLWLAGNAGEQPPAVAFDVENSRAEILDVGFSAWMENLTKKTIANRESF